MIPLPANIKVFLLIKKKNGKSEKSKILQYIAGSAIYCR
jgi:hypothetical protein